MPSLLLALLGQMAAAPADTLRYPEPGDFRHGLSVHADYDPRYDRTVVQLDPVPLDCSVSLAAVSALEGRPIRAPASGVVLTFRVAGKPIEVARGAVIHPLGDAPVGLGPLSPVPAGQSGQVLLTSISLEDWLRLVRAPGARLSLAGRECTLDPALLEAMRDFSSRMRPGQ